MTNEQDLINIELAKRALALRRQGRLGILYCDQGHWAVSDNVLDPWGGRRHMGQQAFAELLNSLEVERKGPEGIQWKNSKKLKSA